MIRLQFRHFRLTIHFSFLLLLSLLLILQEIELGSTFLLALLCHEGGHLLVLLSLHLGAREMELSAFGIALHRQRVGSFRQELLLYAAGPAANLLTAALLLPWNRVAGLFHLILAALNLLPIHPLDGGEITRLLLEQFLDLSAAERTAKSLSRMLWLLLLLAAGLLFLYQHKPTLLLFVLLLGLRQ